MRYREHIALRGSYTSVSFVSFSDAYLHEASVWSEYVLDVKFTRYVIGGIVIGVFQAALFVVPGSHAEYLVLYRRKKLRHSRFLFSRSCKVIERRTYGRSRVVVYQITVEYKVRVFVLLNRSDKLFPRFSVVIDRAIVNVRYRIDFYGLIKLVCDQFEI